MSQIMNNTLTLNGAVTHSSTGSPTLDLFSQGGGLRGKTDDYKKLFVKAWGFNPLNALRLLFYTRDIRGGQGERELFRTTLKWLAGQDPDVVRKNLHLVSEYGRWDDLFSLRETEVWPNALDLIEAQLRKDMTARTRKETVSLCAKWMPREGSRWEEVAVDLRTKMDLTARAYRKMLVALTTVVEQQMCANQWDQIKYDHVPSKAMMIYRGAFERHSPENWKRFMEGVATGKNKINAGAVHPHEIAQKAYLVEDAALDAMWRALPDYLGGKERNIIPVVDVSPSMGGCVWISLALGIYIAERNTGAFKNLFLPFNDHATWKTVDGDTIHQKIKAAYRDSNGYSTNIQAAMELILERAKHSPIDTPEVLLVISDMEFDAAGSESQYGKKTNFQVMKDKFARAGLKAPTVVFWNVQARLGNSPAREMEPGVMMVSGYSPSIIGPVLQQTEIKYEEQAPPTAEQLMLSVINSERYKPVVL